MTMLNSAVTGPPHDPGDTGTGEDSPERKARRAAAQQHYAPVKPPYWPRTADASRAWRGATSKPVRVEVQWRDLDVAIRYSAYGTGRPLLIPRARWNEFIEAVKTGRMDEDPS